MRKKLQAPLQKTSVIANADDKCQYRVAGEICQHEATEIAKAMSSAKLIFKWGLKNKRLLHFVRNDTGVRGGPQ